MSRNSTPRSGSRKPSNNRPEKPYVEFPLTPHPSGYWAKKIRGKLVYFGRWGRRVQGHMERLPEDGWREALEEYKRQADDLHAGRTPRPKTDGLTVADLCNRFLTMKTHQQEAGEIRARQFTEYKSTTDRLVSTFGGARLVSDLAADDFERLRAALAEQFGPVRLVTEIQKVRTVFKYAWESGLIDVPVRFGPGFKKPAAAVLRKHRAKVGPKLFAADEIRAMLDGVLVLGKVGPELVSPGPQLRAMALLGINAGYGATDCALLPLSALDLDNGWVSFPRPKTGTERRAALWPETVAALRDHLAARPAPKVPEAAALVFVTARGRPWTTAGMTTIVPKFTAFLKGSGLHRDGMGFYDLRRTFRTVADETRDFPALDLVMGHADPSMGARYRQRIDDARLRAVAEHVRGWLFGKDGKPDAIEDEHLEPEGREEVEDREDGGDRPWLRLFVG